MGCPLELGWEYEKLESRTVEDYEAEKPSRRLSALELKLSPEERRSILHNYSDIEVRRACRKLSRDHSDCHRKCQRQVQREFFATP